MAKSYKLISSTGHTVSACFKTGQFLVPESLQHPWDKNCKFQVFFVVRVPPTIFCKAESKQNRFCLTTPQSCHNFLRTSQNTFFYLLLEQTKVCQYLDISVLVCSTLLTFLTYYLLSMMSMVQKLSPNCKVPGYAWLSTFMDAAISTSFFRSNSLQHVSLVWWSTFGRVVASDIRGPKFESSHQQIL